MLAVVIDCNLMFHIFQGTSWKPPQDPQLFLNSAKKITGFHLFVTYV